MEPVSVRHAAWIARCLGRGDLAPIDPEDVKALAALVGEDRYAGGMTVFKLGDSPAQVHVVREGSVELSREMCGRRVALQILRAGDIFGDISALIEMEEPFDARALEDCTVLHIDPAELFKLLEERPRLARRWLVSVASRMAQVQARLVDLLAGGQEAQIASVLVREAEQGVVRLSQAMLAELVGGRRTSVNRVLKKLEAKGLVGLRYREVTVLDSIGLSRVASGLA